MLFGHFHYLACFTSQFIQEAILLISSPQLHQLYDKLCVYPSITQNNSDSASIFLVYHQLNWHSDSLSNHPDDLYDATIIKIER